MQIKSGAQAGQVGVVVLLVMTGLLSMGLSLASRSSQETLLSGKKAESARVFNAAEQGVEEALSSDSFGNGSFTGNLNLPNDVEVDYSVVEDHFLETRLFEGISVGVNVTGSTTGDNLRIEWSKEDDCATQSPASLLAAIYNYDSFTNTTRARYAALGACDRGGNFTQAAHVNQDGYSRQYDLPLQDNDFLVRIKAIYNDTNIRVSSSDFTLPIQYYSVRSEAKNTQSHESRVVEVNRTIKSAPSILDYAVYSGNTLSK